MTTELTIIDFTRPQRKCGNCRQPGHTKPHCKRCEYCTDEHPIADCQNPDYANTYRELMLVACYSYAYHGNPRFIHEISRSLGNLSDIPRVVHLQPASTQGTIRYKKTREQFIRSKLFMHYNDDNADIPTRRATALYNIVTTSQQTQQVIADGFSLDEYSIINRILETYYKVTVDVSSDGTILYNQAPAPEFTNITLPNINNDNRIRQHAMTSRMRTHTLQIAYNVRSAISTTANLTREHQRQLRHIETLNRRRQALATIFELYQGRLVHMDNLILQNTITVTNLNDRRIARINMESVDRNLFASAQNNLRQYQITLGLPIDVPQLHQLYRHSDNKTFPNISTRFVLPEPDTTVLSSCPNRPDTTVLSSCPICWDNEIPNEQLVKPGCAHSICSTCLTKYFDTLLPRQVPCCSMCRAMFVNLTFGSDAGHRVFNNKFKTTSDLVGENTVIDPVPIPVPVPV